MASLQSQVLSGAGTLGRLAERFHLAGWAGVSRLMGAMLIGFALVLGGCTQAPADQTDAPTISTPRPTAVAALATLSPAASAANTTQVPTRPPTTPAVEAPPAAYVADPALAALLQALAGDSLPSYGVYVKSLKDGTGASVNADKVFRAASLFKLFVMWEAFRQESLGLISFDTTMEVTPYYKTFELGTNAVEVGDVVTVGEALRLMMAISDTPTGVLLQDTVGIAEINAALEALSIDNSGLFYPGDPLATARDVGVLLESVAAGGRLPEASHDAMVGLLLSEGIDYGLRAGVPSEIGVAHKTGSLPVALHDAGIVYLPGAAYVLVVLWDRQSGVDLIETISRGVYEYYESRN
ncbi:MAG TPA: serine hydrolase [Dehalococcoidia bacterium]|nr:serine hydrolase [Dehalococcoidia bacterium]